MNIQDIINTARAMVAGSKGLLAMDESDSTCNKRFAALGQEAGLVLIVEPEVLMECEHNLDQCFRIKEKVLRKSLYHRAMCNNAARRGEYNSETERTSA